MTNIKRELKKANFHILEAVHILQDSSDLETFYKNFIDFNKTLESGIDLQNGKHLFDLNYEIIKEYPLFIKNMQFDDFGNYLVGINKFHICKAVQNTRIYKLNDHHNRIIKLLVSFNDTHGVFLENNIPYSYAKLIAFSDIPIEDEIQTGF